MRRSFGTVGVTAAVVAAAGCSADRSGRATRVVTDSAGVEVVTVRPPERPQAPMPIPVAEIGVASGAQELEFSDVTGALQLPDGRIVVADGGTSELRFFDAVGSFLQSAGGEGEGPGEFRSIDYFGLLGTDTLVVYDGRLRRLSLLDPTGRFLGSHSVSDVTLPYVVGSLDSGELAAWQHYGPEQEGLGVHAAQVEFGTFALPEASFRVLGTARGAEEARVQYRGRITRAFRPFSREGDIAASGEHMFVLTSSADNRIRVYDATGRLARVLAIDFERKAPTPEDVSGWVESWMEEFQPPSQDVEDWWRFGFREVSPPDSIPLLRSLEVDSEGNVCAERYPLTWGSATHYWCFTPDGFFVRSLELPAGQVRRGPHPYWDTQLQLTPRRAVGVWAEDLGVERVKIFELGAAAAAASSTENASR